MVLVAALLAAGAIYEMKFIHGEFHELAAAAEVLYDKIDAHAATENDVYALQKKWLTKKERLHSFVSHNEIKEFDMWISETVKLVTAEMWDDALSKVEVVKELVEQIPKNFEISWANIF